MSIVRESDDAACLSSTTTKDENANGRDKSQHSKTSDNNIKASNKGNSGEKKTPTKRCKLVIVGDGCCGKTSLLTVFKR